MPGLRAVQPSELTPVRYWAVQRTTRSHPPSDPTATTSPICRPDPDAKKPWAVPEACRSLIAERSPDYDLSFAEFDDQGWPFDAPRYGAAGQQIPIVIDRLSREVAESPRGVSIVTFVHGWKHNAASDDPNVRTFREVLTGLSHLESQTCHRKVVGL